MTPHQRTLTQVRKRIESGLDRFICFALDKVAERHPQYAADCHGIKYKISAQLGSQHASLPHWVLTEMRRVTGEDYPEPYYTAWDKNTDLAVMMRLAWIDKMLEQENNHVPPSTL